MDHKHAFDESKWPFDVAINTTTFTTKNVIEGNFPILEVYHDHDGEWQFMCGTTNATEDARLVCLGCMIERDPTTLQLADMPPGWVAYRTSPDQPWLREQYEDTDESDV